MRVLLAVQDMQRAIRFYTDVFGLEVAADFGANVMLSDGLFLQQADSWRKIIHKLPHEVVLPNNAVELYWEVEDIRLFCRRLKDRGDVVFLHDIITHSWGQRAVRFYDPDYHLIEVGEDMESLVKKRLAEGASPKTIAYEMDVPQGYVEMLSDKEGSPKKGG